MASDLTYGTHCTAPWVTATDWGTDTRHLGTMDMALVTAGDSEVTTGILQ